MATTHKPAIEVLHEISAVTEPMENTLKKLAENPNGTAAGKEQAKQNAGVVEKFNSTVVPAMSAKLTNTHAPTSGIGPGRSGSTTSRGQ